MKNISPIRRQILLTILTMAFALPLNAAGEFAGNLTGVSTYVWRGVKANNGPALQSDAAFTYGIVTLGFWGSSVNFGDDWKQLPGSNLAEEVLTSLSISRNTECSENQSANRVHDR